MYNWYNYITVMFTYSFLNIIIYIHIRKLNIIHLFVIILNEYFKT